jgi:hypothetical protein
MKIVTNNKPRPVLNYWELPENFQKEYFDYQDEAFFIYKNWCYMLCDFMRIRVESLWDPVEFKDWHGYHSDSFFSGILVKFQDNSESIICATYFS